MTEHTQQRITDMKYYLHNNYDSWLDALESEEDFGYMKKSISVKAMMHICDALFTGDDIRYMIRHHAPIQIYDSKGKAWIKFINYLRRYQDMIFSKIDEHIVKKNNVTPMHASVWASIFTNAFMNAPLSKKAYLEWGCFFDDSDKDPTLAHKELKYSNLLEHRAYFVPLLADFSTKINIEYLFCCVHYQREMGITSVIHQASEASKRVELPRTSVCKPILESVDTSKIMKDVVDIFNPVEEVG